MGHKRRELIHSVFMAVSSKKMRKAIKTCSEVTQSLANKEHLSFVQQLQLKAHLFMCNCCVGFQEDLYEVDAFLHQDPFANKNLDPQRMEAFEKQVIQSHSRHNQTPSSDC